MEALVGRNGNAERYRARRRFDPAMIEEAAPGFGRALRAARFARRMPQVELGERAGFDHSYVARLELGTRTPTRDAIGRFAAALGCDDGARDGLLLAAGFAPSSAGDEAAAWVGYEAVRALGEFLAAAEPADVALVTWAVLRLVGREEAS